MLSSGTAYLKIWIDDSAPAEFVEKYREHIAKHNEAISTDAHPNSGFDLFVPESVNFEKQFATILVNHKIKCSMVYVEPGTNETKNSAYYLYPRSSICKTPLMLANSVGIIDSGYRGWICSALRLLDADSYQVEGYTRITQICHPSLCPIRVSLVDYENDLGTTTRGEGGFGSTGR